jgi:hypothetical protein
VQLNKLKETSNSDRSKYMFCIVPVRSAFALLTTHSADSAPVTTRNEFLTRLIGKRHS